MPAGRTSSLRARERIVTKIPLQRAAVDTRRRRQVHYAMMTIRGAMRISQNRYSDANWDTVNETVGRGDAVCGASTKGASQDTTLGHVRCNQVACKRSFERTTMRTECK